MTVEVWFYAAVELDADDGGVVHIRDAGVVMGDGAYGAREQVIQLRRFLDRKERR